MSGIRRPKVGYFNDFFKISVNFAPLYLHLRLKIINDISTFRKSNTVVTIGIFDGVHLGHVQILNRLKKLAEEYNGESVVFTLWPHPRFVLQPENKELRLLASLDEKIEMIRKHGVDNLVILPFNRQLADITYDHFFSEYIMDHAGAKHVVVGYNHHFGKDRKGTFENLQKSARQHGIKAERLNQVIIDDMPVSSSAIRKMIDEGKISEANRILGYPYFLTGRVVEGNKIGRTLGYPTANLQIEESLKLLPRNGVYAVLVRLGERVFDGMVNVGVRPTLTLVKHDRLVEANIFGFEEEIYGKSIKVAFLKWLRTEKKFRNMTELTKEMASDKLQALKVLEEYKNKESLI